ncbi:MAG: histidine kinase [Bacteroidetes bacterium]|nr:histidine kinase [Bacteroidota bacterium]
MKIATTYSFKRITLGYFLWWIFWTLVQTFVLHRLNLSWSISITDALIFNGVIGLSACAASCLYRYYKPDRSNRIYLVVFALFITVVLCNVFKWLLQYIYVSNADYLNFLEASMPVRFVFALMMMSFVNILNLTANSMQEQTNQEQRETETKQLAKEAELIKLRQQLQPHFLFNSLNSISALAGSKPEEARKMIYQLSDFLRGTLKKDEQETIFFKEELQHLSLYLDIEKVRFGHRLNIDLNCDENTEQAKIPHLLLQPIVENAIKFGLYGTIDEITVSIKAHVENSNLIVEVKNPFDEQTQNAKKGTGFGLTSVQRRLFLLYSRNDLLTTEKQETIFITRLKIPQTV